MDKWLHIIPPKKCGRVARLPLKMLAQYVHYLQPISPRSILPTFSVMLYPLTVGPCMLYHPGPSGWASQRNSDFSEKKFRRKNSQQEFWSSPKSRSWKNNLNASSLFGKWSQESVAGKWGSETEKRRNQTNGCYPATYPCGQLEFNFWRDLENSEEHGPVSCPTWEWGSPSIYHHFPSVIGWGLTLGLCTWYVRSEELRGRWSRGPPIGTWRQEKNREWSRGSKSYTIML